MHILTLKHEKNAPIVAHNRPPIYILVFAWLPKRPKTEILYHRKALNIASGSEANMTILCEMEFFDFLWLILVHYLPLPPT